jgi:hypothetical protein
MAGQQSIEGFNDGVRSPRRLCGRCAEKRLYGATPTAGRLSEGDFIFPMMLDAGVEHHAAAR